MRKISCMAMALGLALLFGGEASAALMEGTVGPGKHMNFYEKFYRGQEIYIELEGDGSSDVDLVIRDADGDVVCESDTTDADEWCLLTASRTQVYEIRVENYGGSTTDFEVYVD